MQHIFDETKNRNQLAQQVIHWFPLPKLHEEQKTSVGMWKAYLYPDAPIFLKSWTFPHQMTSREVKYFKLLSFTYEAVFNYGKGVCQNMNAGQVRFYPHKKLELIKFLAMLKRDTISFELVLTQELDILAILKGGANKL